MVLSKITSNSNMDVSLDKIQVLQISSTTSSSDEDPKVPDLKEELHKFLDDLKMKMRKNRLLPERAPYFEMPLKLLQSLCQFIWDIDLLKGDEVICDKVYRHFQQDFFQMGPIQTDLDDYLEFKPVEAIAAKCGQIFIKMISGAVDLAFSEVGNLEKLLSDKKIARDNENLQGFRFLADTLKLTLNVLADIEMPKEDEIPCFDDLNKRSQFVVQGAKVYLMKAFRYKAGERLDLLSYLVDADDTNVEWLVTWCEIHRRRRRESATGKAKRAAPEESEKLTTALIMAKENPFVIMGLIDFIIDHMRDSKGRFHVADMDYDSQEDIMTCFQGYCQYIIKEYPRNVSFTSIISDYYLRYVPFAYFDVVLGGSLLQQAYELNPENPKTTHRLGIYHRMSCGDIDESFKWFHKTVQFDPTHFNAVMEYYKTAIGKLDHWEVVQSMRSKLNEKELGCWTEIEVHEFKFLLSLAYFASGDKERTLEMWEEIVVKNQIVFRLHDLDRTCGFYNWNPQKLSSDKLRLWMKAEKDLMSSITKAGEKVDEKRKTLVDLLFSLMLGGGRPNKMESIMGPFRSNHRMVGHRFQNMINNVFPK